MNRWLTSMNSSARHSARTSPDRRGVAAPALAEVV
jgi:hypothetical protein